MNKLGYYIGIHQINKPFKLIVVLIILLSGFWGLNYSLKTYPEFFKTEITIQKTTDISPKENLVIFFSVPISSEEYRSAIKITSETKSKFKMRWEESNKKLTIIPTSFWNPGMNYKIYLPYGKNIMFLNVFEREIDFSVQKYPKVVNFFPKNNEKDFLTTMEEPIMAEFDKSTKDFSVKFLLNPHQELSIQSDDEKKQFKIMPQGLPFDATKYELNVFIKYSDEPEESYRNIYLSSYETPPPPTIIWEKDYALRLDQARKFGRAKIKTGKYIDINLPAQIMSIFEEGKIVDAFLISSGKRGMDTPKMETKIYNKFPRAFSKKYGLYMPNWMALVPDGKFGVHELPEWPGGYKEGTNHLGIPVSHGCVRLGVGPAEKVYNFAEVGTPVIIY
jgi:lipoprotein-anchoring transpeptidase ErfK/SrfK